MPLEYRVNWAGTPVTGAGVSVFHARTDGIATTGAASESFADRVRTFFEAIKGLVPGGITWSYPPEVLELDTTTKQLIDVHSISPPADSVSGAASSSHSRPSGGRVDWLTSAVVNGRRLRGRTYIVPLSGAQYDSAGSLTTTAITALEAAANTYRSTGVFTEATPVVWSRTHGILADIVGSNVDDRASILRSRRD